jgi:hypothetical protein
MKMKDICKPIKKDEDIECLDCMDLHHRNIEHMCHCHVNETNKLPNLGPLIGSEIIAVFYMREREGGPIKGISITTTAGEVKVDFRRSIVSYDRPV